MDTDITFYKNITFSTCVKRLNKNNINLIV